MGIDMKINKYSLFVLLIIMSISLSNSYSETEGRKIALIIAIAKYENFKGINSDKDVPVIKTALENQGFNDIEILLNEQATRTGIDAALERLYKKAGMNDIIVIHFSSHGQQIFDDNNDELDKLDEAIVCYDGKSMFADGYKGENHFRDDELGAYLNKLRTKLGKNGEVIVFVDACHSGTATRGEAVVRSAGPPLVPEGFKYSEEGDESTVFEKHGSKTRGGNQADLIVISAARAEERNYEYNGKGSLSYAISNSLAALNGPITYRGLFSKITGIMSTVASKQHPVIEGDGLDKQIFGGKSVIQKKFFKIEDILTDRNLIVIEGGTFANIYEGSKIEIFPAGTSDPKNAEPICKGEIKESNYFYSHAAIDGIDKLTNKDDYWAFVTEYKLKPFKFSVKLNKFSSDDEKKSFQEHFAEQKYMTLINNSDSNNFADIWLDYEELGNGKRQTIIRDAQSGEVISEKESDSKSAIETADKELQRLAQSKLIRELKLDDEDYLVEIEFIPVKNKIGKTFKDTLDLKNYYKDGVLNVSTKDTFLIKVKNDGFESAYFNIIDIQPDGYINLIVPNPGFNEDPSSYKIEAETEKIIPNRYFVFYPPTGTEVFKVFATAFPIDFKPIIGTRGNSTRKGRKPHPLENIIKGSFNMTTRGEKTESLNWNSYGNTYEYVFQITK